MAAVVPVVLFGVGGVGREVIRLLERRAQCLSKTHTFELQLLALVDSSAAILSTGRTLPYSVVRTILKAKSEAGSFAKIASKPEFLVLATSEGNTSLSLWDHIRDVSRCVIVDCTADASMVDVLLTALRMNESWRLVLANKKPLTGSIEKYRRLTSNPARVKYESTVGASLPIITSINRILSSGDRIHRVQGVFSGTLGYLCSGLEDGNLYSQVLCDAKSKGYTEPDPRDDLSGMDAARKALIIARLLGGNVELDDLAVHPMFPKSMSTVGADEFMGRLKELDEEYMKKSSSAAERGLVLRYVADLKYVEEKMVIEVGLMEVSGERSSIGRLKGTGNIISIYTQVYDDAPLVIQGRGAGPTATAAGVLSDIVDLFT